MTLAFQNRWKQRHAITAIARFTIIESVRARFIWAVLLMSLSIFTTVVFVDALSIIESAQSAISIAAPLARLLAVGLLAAFVIFNTSRELENGAIELMLAAPISRSAWLIGRFAGSAVLATGITLAVTISLSLFVEPIRLMTWSASLLGELLLVGGLGLLMAVSLNKAAVALLGFAAFYLFARIVGVIQMLQHSSPEGSSPSQLITPIISLFVDLLTVIMPRIDLMSRTDWLVGGPASGAWISPMVVVPGVIQVAVYLLLIAIVSSIDLERRNV